MKNVVDLFLMILQSLSTVIIDMFYFMTVFVAFMTVFRFEQFGIMNGKSIKHARELTIEYSVQGIVIGGLLSCVVVFVGMPVMYSDYLYFLLPLSFILGFYHIRFTNIIYGASMMAILGLALNGQIIGEQVMPDIGINPTGLALITGLLMILIGLMMAMTGTSRLMPIAAIDGKRKILGFAMQQFWPVPIVLLAAVKVMVTGETVEMPDWWPMLALFNNDATSVSMFLLPMLLVVSHGSVSFGQRAEDHIRYQYLQQIGGGIVLLLVGYIGSQIGHVELFAALILILVATVPEVYWYYMELGSEPCYTLEEPGVIIIGVDQKSLASNYGFEIGDCIMSINDTEVKDWEHLSQWVQVYDGGHQIKLLRHSSDTITIQLDQCNMTDEGFGLTPMRIKPTKFHKVEDITQMNMMHLMRFSRRKDDSE